MTNRKIHFVDTDFSNYTEKLKELEEKRELTDEEIEEWAKAKAGAWLLAQAQNSDGVVSEQQVRMAVAQAIFWASRDMYELEVKGKDPKREPIGKRVLGFFLRLFPPHRHDQT